MCTACSTGLTVDTAKSEAFAGRMVEMINGSALMLMTSIGHRTGLFDTMARIGPATSHALAHEAGLNERYVREWLGAMVTGSFVDYDPQEQTYHLPAEHAAVLTRAASPNNLAVTAQWIPLLGSAQEPVIEAFTHGKGVPYSAYRDFHRVMAEESGQTTVGGLQEHILPLVDGLETRLATGIDVVDIACGAGGAIIHLAEMHPASRFVGIDASVEAIEMARSTARQKGLRNVRFEVMDLAEWSEAGAYDLVTGFDAIHDQARPQQVLDNIRRALRPGGVFLMQDILAETALQDNLDKPLGPFTYTISCMHCMSVSLAGGGPGLGAAWGKELALSMLDAAGFGNVTVQTLPHDPINYYYVARPA